MKFLGRKYSGFNFASSLSTVLHKWTQQIRGQSQLLRSNGNGSKFFHFACLALDRPNHSRTRSVWKTDILNTSNSIILLQCIFSDLDIVRKREQSDMRASSLPPGMFVFGYFPDLALALPCLVSDFRLVES